MAQVSPIDDAYIDDIIKSAGAYDPALNVTQGVKLRELFKLMRDRLEQGIAQDQFNPIAGTGISLSGSYPNITFNTTVPDINGKANLSGGNAFTGVQQFSSDFIGISGQLQVTGLVEGGAGSNFDDLRIVSSKPFFEIEAWGHGTIGASPANSDIQNLSNGFVMYGKTDNDFRSHLSWKVRNFSNTDLASYGGTLIQTVLTEDRNWILPNKSGTIALSSDLGTYEVSANKLSNGMTSNLANENTYPSTLAVMNVVPKIYNSVSTTITPPNPIQPGETIAFTTQLLRTSDSPVLKGDPCILGVDTYDIGLIWTASLPYDNSTVYIRIYNSSSAPITIPSTGVRVTVVKGSAF